MRVIKNNFLLTVKIALCALFFAVAIPAQAGEIWDFKDYYVDANYGTATTTPVGRGQNQTPEDWGEAGGFGRLYFASSNPSYAIKSIGYALCADATTTADIDIWVNHVDVTTVQATSSVITRSELPDCATYQTNYPSLMEMTYFEFSTAIQDWASPAHDDQDDYFFIRTSATSTETGIHLYATTTATTNFTAVYPYMAGVTAKVSSGGAYTVSGLNWPMPFIILRDTPYYGNDSSTTLTECTTCTRITSHDPEVGETVATSTNTINIGYYISEDDYCSSLLCQSYIKIGVLEPLSSTKMVYVGEVMRQGNNTFSHTFTDMGYATGTVTTEIEIFNDYTILPTNTKLLEVYKWYKVTANTEAETQAYASTTRSNDWETQISIDEGSLDVGSTDNPNIISRVFVDTVNDFLRLPPWGYIYVFNDTMQNPTATDIATTTLTHTFPAGMPAEGLSITLDVASGVSSTIAMIRQQTVSTIDGDPFDKFLEYWETIWYIIFALWVIRETVQAFRGVSIEYNPNAGNYQKRGFVRGVRSGRSKGATNIPIH